MEAAEESCHIVTALQYETEQMRRHIAEFCVSGKGKGFKLLHRGFNGKSASSEVAARDVLAQGSITLFLVMTAAQGSIDTIRCVRALPMQHVCLPVQPALWVL